MGTSQSLIRCQRTTRLRRVSVVRRRQSPLKSTKVQTKNQQHPRALQQLIRWTIHLKEASAEAAAEAVAQAAAEAVAQAAAEEAAASLWTMIPTTVHLEAAAAAAAEAKAAAAVSPRLSTSIHG